MAAVNARIDMHPPQAVAIVLDTDYLPPLRGIRCGASGNVAVVNHDGNTLTFTNVAAGEVIRGTFQQVKTTGTTVASPTTNLIGYK